jgi:hypothetical protein
LNNDRYFALHDSSCSARPDQIVFFAFVVSVIRKAVRLVV